MLRWLETKVLFRIYKLYFIWKNSFLIRFAQQQFPEGVNIHNSVVFGRNTEIEYSFFKGNLNIEEGVLFRKFCNVLMYNNGHLTIEKNVFFNNYCSVNCLDSITIGENTILGEGVKIYDHNHKYSTINEILNISRNEFTLGRIKIGKNCWIGSNVTILKGVEIGDNVIIGSGCLVYKSIPSNTIVKASSSVDLSQYE